MVAQSSCEAPLLHVSTPNNEQHNMAVHSRLYKQLLWCSSDYEVSSLTVAWSVCVHAASGQYANSRVCGLCLRFRGTKPGGTIPLNTEYALSEFSRSRG